MIQYTHAMRRELMIMVRFIPKGKLSKKAQKELNRQRRVTWEFSPVTKTVDSRKIYSRKKKAQNRDDYGLSFFLYLIQGLTRYLLFPDILCIFAFSVIQRADPI